MSALMADTALQLISAAREHAASLEAPMAFAVVDAGGHPLAMLRMDGASLLAATTVVAKARTAVYCRRPTHVIVERAGLFPEVWSSLVSTAVPPLLLSMGGFPLECAGEIVGGFASSGGSGEQDIEVSQQALTVWTCIQEAGR
ncbi:MAG: heme-binding protein [Gammaproteobacteria bacterium]|nr:MAG: heme-binding protein [Gammaproteobacteria bacterium]